MDELGMAITRGMQAGLAKRDEFFRLVPAISHDGDVFRASSDRGGRHPVSCPRRGTMFLVNETDGPIADPTFFQALTRVWLGKKPRQDLKDALLTSVLPLRGGPALSRDVCASGIDNAIDVARAGTLRSDDMVAAMVTSTTGQPCCRRLRVVAESPGS